MNNKKSATTYLFHATFYLLSSRNLNTAAKVMNGVSGLPIRSWLPSPILLLHEPLIYCDGDETLFGLSLSQHRFYTFMASSKLPWSRLWTVLWSLIPNPTTKGRLLLALDDFINPKTCKKIFGCASFFDHAAKTSQSKYSWSQNVVSIGLLKIVKGCWACLPLAFRFYHMRKTIGAENIKVNGKIPPFQTKFDQVVEILPEISAAFSGTPLLVVADSWFDNDESAQAYAQNHWAAHAYSFQIARQRHFVCATTRTIET